MKALVSVFSLLLLCQYVCISVQQEEKTTADAKLHCVQQADGSCLSTEHKKTRKTYPPFTLQASLPSLCDVVGHCGEVLRLNTSEHALSRYLRDRQPVLLTGGDSQTQSWKALKWNLWYWASKTWTNMGNVIELRQPRELADGVILIRDQETAEAWSSFQSFSLQDDMLLWDYLNDISPHNQSEVQLCRFYSTDYQEMESSAKLQGDSNWKALRVAEDIGLSAKDTKELVNSIPPLFNFLYPGCTLQGRYQDYHTVRVQVLGSAKYYFVSPKKISDFLPFPFSHSASRQSQVNLRAVMSLANIDDEEEQFEMSQRDMFLYHVKRTLEGRRAASKSPLLQVVTLHAGDTLYLPPGYMVFTEAITPAVFIDVLSPSREQILLMEAMMTLVPMEKHANAAASAAQQDEKNKAADKKATTPTTTEEQVIFTQVFLVHVLSRIQGISSIGRYTRKLYKSRYESLYPLESLHMQKLATEFNCYKDQKELHDRVVRSMDQDRIESVASFVAKRFNDPALQRNGLKWVWLSDYIDSIISQLWDNTNRLDKAALFLHSCLDMDTKLEIVEEELGPSVVHLNPIF